MPYERARRSSTPTYSQMKNGMFTDTTMNTFTPVVIASMPTHSSPADTTATTFEFTDPLSAGTNYVLYYMALTSDNYALTDPDVPRIIGMIEFSTTGGTGGGAGGTSCSDNMWDYPGMDKCGSGKVPIDAAEMATTIGDSVAICCKLDGSSGGYCSAGMYQLEGTGCVNCGIGKFTITQGSQLCSDCAMGMYQEFEGSTACTDCAIGMYQEFEGSTACNNCEKGYFSSSSGSQSCTTCSYGQYTDETGSAVCKYCDSPSTCTTTSNGGSNSNSCTAGTFPDTMLPGNPCVNCGYGKYSFAGAQSCTDCDANSYQDKEGQASCLSCPASNGVRRLAGTGNTGSTSCSDCPFGCGNGGSGGGTGMNYMTAVWGANAWTPVNPKVDPYMSPVTMAMTPAYRKMAYTISQGTGQNVNIFWAVFYSYDYPNTTPTEQDLRGRYADGTLFDGGTTDPLANCQNTAGGQCGTTADIQGKNPLLWGRHDSETVAAMSTSNLYVTMLQSMLPAGSYVFYGVIEGTNIVMKTSFTQIDEATAAIVTDLKVTAIGAQSFTVEVKSNEMMTTISIEVGPKNEPAPTAAQIESQKNWAVSTARGTVMVAAGDTWESITFDSAMFSGIAPGLNYKVYATAGSGTPTVRGFKTASSNFFSRDYSVGMDTVSGNQLCGCVGAATTTDYTTEAMCVAAWKEATGGCVDQGTTSDANGNTANHVAGTISAVSVIRRANQVYYIDGKVNVADSASQILQNQGQLTVFIGIFESATMPFVDFEAKVAAFEASFIVKTGRYNALEGVYTEKAKAFKKIVVDTSTTQASYDFALAVSFVSLITSEGLTQTPPLTYFKDYDIHTVVVVKDSNGMSGDKFAMNEKACAVCSFMFDPVVTIPPPEVTATGLRVSPVINLGKAGPPSGYDVAVMAGVIATSDIQSKPYTNSRNILQSYNELSTRCEVSFQKKSLISNNDVSASATVGTVNLNMPQTGLQNTVVYSLIAVAVVYKDNLIYAVSESVVIQCPTDVCQESTLEKTNVELKQNSMTCDVTWCEFKAKPPASSTQAGSFIYKFYLHEGAAPTAPTAAELNANKDGSVSFAAKSEWATIRTEDSQPLLSERDYTVFVVIRNALGQYGEIEQLTEKTKAGQAELSWYPDWKYPLLHGVGAEEGIEVKTQVNVKCSLYFGWKPVADTASDVSDAPKPATLDAFNTAFTAMNTVVRPDILAGTLVELSTKSSTATIEAGEVYDLAVLAVTPEKTLGWYRRITILSGTEIAAGGPYDMAQSDKYHRVTVCPAPGKSFKAATKYVIRALDKQNWQGAGFQVYRLASTWLSVAPDVRDDVQDDKTYQIRTGIGGATAEDGTEIVAPPITDPGYITPPADTKRSFTFPSMLCPEGFFCPVQTQGDPQIKYCGEGVTMDAASRMYCPAGSAAPQPVPNGLCGFTSRKVIGWPNWNIQVEPFPSTNFGTPYGRGDAGSSVAQLVQAMQTDAIPCANLTFIATPDKVQMEQTDAQTFDVKIKNIGQAIAFFSVKGGHAWNGAECTDNDDNKALLQSKVTPSKGYVGAGETVTVTFAVAGNQLGVGASNIRLCLDVLSLGLDGAPFVNDAALKNDLTKWSKSSKGWLANGNVTFKANLDIDATVDTFSGLLSLPQKLREFTLASESAPVSTTVLVYWVAKDTGVRWNATVDQTLAPDLDTVPKGLRNKKVRTWLTLSRDSYDAKQTGDFIEVVLTLDPKSLPALKRTQSDSTRPSYQTHIRFSSEIYNASGVISTFESIYQVTLGIYPGEPVKTNTCFNPLNPLACMTPADSSTATGGRRLYGPLEEGIHDGMAVNSRYASFLIPRRLAPRYERAPSYYDRFQGGRALAAQTDVSNAVVVTVDMFLDLGSDLEIFLLQRDSLNQPTAGTEGVFTSRLFINGNPIPYVKKVESVRAETSEYKLKDVIESQRNLFHKLTVKHNQGTEGLRLDMVYLMRIYQTDENADSPCAPGCAIANLTLQIRQKNCSYAPNMILSPKLNNDEKNRNCICKEDFKATAVETIGGVKVPTSCVACTSDKTKVVHAISKMDPEDTCSCRFGSPKTDGSNTCEPCEDGEYFVQKPENSPAAWTCRACEPGKKSKRVDTNFTNTVPGSKLKYLQKNVCVGCEAGSKSNADRTGCDECGDRQYSAASKAQCYTCYAEMDTLGEIGNKKELTPACEKIIDDSIDEVKKDPSFNGTRYNYNGMYPECHPCKCREGYYYDRSWVYGSPGLPCQPCEALRENGQANDERTYCKKGTYGTEQIVLRPGHWRFNTSSVLYHRCDAVDKALGDRANMFMPCLGGKKSTCGPVFTQELYDYMKLLPKLKPTFLPLVRDWAGLAEKIEANPSSTLADTGFDFKGNAIKPGVNNLMGGGVNATSNYSSSLRINETSLAQLCKGKPKTACALAPAFDKYTGNMDEVAAELLRLAFDTIDPRNDELDIHAEFLKKMARWTTEFDVKLEGKVKKQKKSDGNSTVTSVVGFYSGVKCYTCPFGSGSNEGLCQECPEGIMNYVILGAYLLIMIVLVVIMTVVQVKASDVKKGNGGNFEGMTMEQHARRMREYRTASGGEADYKQVVVGIFRILLSYAQVASFAKMLPIEWPSHIRQFFADMMRWTTPRLHMSSLECAVRTAGSVAGVNTDAIAAYRAKFFMVMSFPVLTLLIPALFYSLYYVINRNKAFTKVDIEEHEMDYEEVSAILDTRHIQKRRTSHDGGQIRTMTRSHSSAAASQVQKWRLACGMSSNAHPSHLGDCKACRKPLSEGEIEQITKMDPIHSDACPICSNKELKAKYKKASAKRTLKRQKSRSTRGERFTKHDGGHEKKEDGGEGESPMKPVISDKKRASMNFIEKQIGEKLTRKMRGSKTVSTAMAHWCVSCEQGVHAGECIIQHYKGHWRKRATDFFWITVLVVMFLEYTYVFKTIANVFGCFGIYKSKSSEEPSINYLLDDPNIMCYTPDHYFLLYIGLALMVLYGLGIPLAAFTILFQNREAIIYEEASYKPCIKHDWQMPGCESLTSCTCPLFDPNSAIRRMHPNLSTGEFMIRLKRRASQIDVRAKFGFLFEGFEKHGICPYVSVAESLFCPCHY